MEQFRIALTRKSKKDIIDIGDYISFTLLEPDTSRNFVKGLRSSIRTLREMPKRYSLIDDVVLSNQGVRCMPYKNYYIFFQVFEQRNTVVILRIGYNRRNWKEILIKDI